MIVSLSCLDRGKDTGTRCPLNASEHSNAGFLETLVSDITYLLADITQITPTTYKQNISGLVQKRITAAHAALYPCC